MNLRPQDDKQTNEAFSTQHIPVQMSLTQDLKRKVLLAIEEALGSEIENDLEKRAQLLPNVNFEELIAEYMQLSSVRKFQLRAKSKFPDLDMLGINGLIKKYFESHINFAQSYMLEQELLSVSYYARQYFGLDQAILLLENIHDPEFDLPKFMDENIQRQKTIKNKNESREEKTETKPTIFDNPAKFQRITLIIDRIRNVYAHAEIKKTFYREPELQQEQTYKNLQESLMWLDGQRLTCVTGMRNIQEKKVRSAALAIHKPLKTSALQGACAHLQNIIGIFVDDELQNLANILAETAVDNIVEKLKSKVAYQQLTQALTKGTRAGFDSYLPHASLENLIRMIEEYLQVSVHLAQSLMHEKHVIRISQTIRQNYGIAVARSLLIEMEKIDFNVNLFFATLTAPSEEIKALIVNLQSFYIYAAIKKQDNFFDNEEPQALKLFESEMWIGLQRRCCIQGMSLIHSGEVYQGKSICFDNLEQAIEVATNEEKTPILQEQQAHKKVRLDSSTSSFLSGQPRSIIPAIFDWSILQRGMSEDEAFAEAIRESQRVQNLNGVTDEDAALNEALRRSRSDIAPMLLDEKPAPIIPAPNRALEEKRDRCNRTELMNAAAQGQMNEVVRLVNAGANLQLIGEYGNKAIHYAAENNRLEVMAFLITKGASPFETNRNQQSAHQLARLSNLFLEAACRGDNTELSRLMTDLKVPVDCRGANSKTALMIAAAEGKMNTVKFLLETAHADLNVVGQYGNKAIHFAAESDRFDVMAYLITQGASPFETNRNQQSAHQLSRIANQLLLAASRGNITELQRLITDFKVPVDIRGANSKTALMIATAEGRLDTVKYLLETAHADLNVVGQYGNKAIHYAAENERFDVMAYLITQGASPLETNRNQQSAHHLSRIANQFVQAAYRGSITELQRLIIDFKVPVDIRGANSKTALMTAAEEGKLDTVIYLVETAHADVDAIGQYGNKAMHYAAASQRFDVMAYLITKGASPLETNNNSQSAHQLSLIASCFIEAARRGDNTELQRLIIDLKVPVDSRGVNNKTALMIAAEEGKFDTVKFLHEAFQAIINTVGQYGNKAIHYAAVNKKLNVMAYLIDQGASPSEPNNNNQSAIDLAQLGDKFLDAARRSDNSTLQQMLTVYKVSVEIRGANYKTALMVAAEAGQLATAKFLHETLGANIHALGQYGYKAIHFAAANNHELLVEYLLSKGASPADVTSNRQTVWDLLRLEQKFFNAAEQGDLAELKRIIRVFQLPATVRGQFDKTALMVAAHHNQFAVIQFLVEECLVPIDDQDRSHKRALDYAANHGAIVEYLILHGAIPLAVTPAQEEKDPAQASPRISSPADNVRMTPEIATPSNTILADTHTLLALLQREAKWMENESDDARAPYWWTSDENDANYYKAHNAECSLEKSGLNQERFYAAGILLELGVSRICADDRGFPNNEIPLEISMRQGTNNTIMTAAHNRRLLQRRALGDSLPGASLPAPIVIFPFELLKKTITDVLTICFTNWGSDNLYQRDMTQTFASSNDMYRAFSWLTDIEKACNEIDKEFTLGLSSDLGHDNKISVSKQQLAKAKTLIGYSTALQYGQLPSMAQLVATSSPVSSSSAVSLSNSPLVNGSNDEANEAHRAGAF